MHYLEAELQERIATDPAMWEFLRAGSLDGVWYWDLENREHEWMSPELWRLFGFDPAEKSHDPSEWFDLINPDDLQLAIQNLDRHLADPDHPYDQIVRYRHKNGSTVWVRCRGIAVRDDTGKPVRMLGAHNDVTALKCAEEAARHDRNAQRSASEELRAFAYSVSHDLKSPANSLLLLLGELSEGARDSLDEDSRQLLDLSLSTVEQMRKLIEDLLQYTRLIEAEPELEKIDLNELFDEVQQSLSGPLENSGAVVTRPALPEILGSRVPLRIMFENLVENAVKYAKPDTPLKLSIGQQAEPDGRVRIDVRDNGIGIESDYQDRIFKMFKRLHNADDIPGSGLGLALCRRIALNHGSDISVQSVPSEGSTFSVTLPCERPAP